VEKKQLFMGFLFYCKALQGGVFFFFLPSKAPLGMEDAFANRRKLPPFACKTFHHSN
jgi:hypothetical protein